MLKYINESFDKKYQRKKSVAESYAYRSAHKWVSTVIPKGVKVLKWRETSADNIVIYLDKKLTAAQQEEYDLSPIEQTESLHEYSNVREYSDMLFDMIEEGIVDAEAIAKDLIYWCSEDDIKRYMEVNDLIEIEYDD